MAAALCSAASRFVARFSAFNFLFSSAASRVVSRFASRCVSRLRLAVALCSAASRFVSRFASTFFSRFSAVNCLFSSSLMRFVSMLRLAVDSLFFAILRRSDSCRNSLSFSLSFCLRSAVLKRFVLRSRSFFSISAKVYQYYIQFMNTKKYYTIL